MEGSEDMIVASPKRAEAVSAFVAGVVLLSIFVWVSSNAAVGVSVLQSARDIPFETIEKVRAALHRIQWRFCAIGVPLCVGFSLWLQWMICSRRSVAVGSSGVSIREKDGTVREIERHRILGTKRRKRSFKLVLRDPDEEVEIWMPFVPSEDEAAFRLECEKIADANA